MTDSQYSQPAALDLDDALNYIIQQEPGVGRELHNDKAATPQRGKSHSIVI